LLSFYPFHRIASVLSWSCLSCLLRVRWIISSGYGKVKPKIIKLVFDVSLVLRYAALRSKSKDWLARNRDNLPEWSDMYIRDGLVRGLHWMYSALYLLTVICTLLYLLTVCVLVSVLYSILVHAKSYFMVKHKTHNENDNTFVYFVFCLIWRSVQLNGSILKGTELFSNMFFF
jgi:hypothetical protein